MNNKQMIWTLVVLGGLMTCTLIGLVIGWQLYFTVDPSPDQQNLVVDALAVEVATAPPSLSPPRLTPDRRPTDTPTLPAATPTPRASHETHSTETALLEAILPIRDQRLLAMRLRHHDQIIPEVVRETSPGYQVGDNITLWVTDNYATPPRHFEVEATLQYLTDHSYWWVEQGFNIDPDDLEQSAKQFENHTYPTNRAFFGSEWSPGIDGDVRVHIFMGDVPGVAGYFAAANSYSKLAETYSNEQEMFFINLRAIRPGNSSFDGVLAHEFQHMIHWHQDRNEDTWVNEGLSELATFINGYGPSNFMGTYIAQPDTQLNSWAIDPSGAIANYGGSFLFMAYFLEHYGEDMMKAVVANPYNGVAGFDAVLSDQAFPERFDDIFADFLVANYLDEPTAGQGRWGYKDISPPSVVTAAEYKTYPIANSAQVKQYGADYIELTADGPLTIEFTGNKSVSVVDNQAHSGDYQWYGHRGDDSNTRLTRTFDLSEVETAQLKFWTWYDIEPSWDYAYVSISTNEGQTWTLLPSGNSTTDNPAGNSYGPGYTGTSAGWQEEIVDLTPYVGQEVLIRFEYVTDDAVNHPGWTIDDISIPEIGFFDDVETGPNGWQAEGFVRIDNQLPQHFLVQLLEIGEEVTVRPMPLSEDNTGQLTIAGLGSTVDLAVLIISGLTPVTTEPASYEYRLTIE